MKEEENQKENTKGQYENPTERPENPKRQKANLAGNPCRVGLLALCSMICVGCAVWLIADFVRRSSQESQMNESRNAYAQEGGKREDSEMPPAQGASQTATEPPETVTEPQETATGSSDAAAEPSQAELPSLEGYDVPEMEIDFAGLRTEQNQDIYAWITVPGTKVDYPVLQHPEIMDYYLEYNIDGSKGYPGCIYTQLINSRDWTDSNTVLYGHNMRNGTMFGSLHAYEDEDFFREYPYIYLYTEDTTYVYQIFAAYEYSDIHLLLGLDISTPEKYQEYLDSIFEHKGANDHFDTEAVLTSESRIITLSTCISGKADRRWLVQAVLTAAGQTAAAQPPVPEAETD